MIDRDSRRDVVDTERMTIAYVRSIVRWAVKRSKMRGEMKRRRRRGGRYRKGEGERI